MPEPLFSDPTLDPLTSALHKLRWARGGEWSVPLTPGECGAVLDALEAPPVDTRETPYYQMMDVVVSSSQTGVDAVSEGPHDGR